MYEDFYQLNADPFRLSPDHRLCFTHSSYEKARAYMAYALHRSEGFVMVTGKPGSGKTTLINDILDDLSLSTITVGMLMSTQLEADDLLRMVAFSFGLAGDLSHKSAILQDLKTFFTRLYHDGQRALLIVDEAQDLSISAMEELRLLTNLQIDNQPLLQIFLVGQEELRDLMQEPRMVQGHQRVVAACHLEPLNEDEIGDYIKHRLRKVGWNGDPQISATIFPIIHKFSLGVPRKVNLICSRLFLHAFVEEHHKIGVTSIRTVLTELQQEQLISSSLPGYSEVKPGDFFDLEDDYGSEVVQSLESGSTANEINSPAASVAELKALQNPGLPVIESSATSKPNKLVSNAPVPSQSPTPCNVTQAGFTNAPGATSDEPVSAESVSQEDKETDPGRGKVRHITPLGKAPKAPRSPRPIPVEAADPAPTTAQRPGPAFPKKDDAPTEKAPLDSSEMSHSSMAAPAGLSAIRHSRRYWYILLPLVGLPALGWLIYDYSQASIDSKALIRQVDQFKSSIVSKLSVQAVHTESFESIEPVERPTVIDAAASDPEPDVEMSLEKALPPVEQVRQVDESESKNGLPPPLNPVGDESTLAVKEPAVEKSVTESRGGDAGKATLATEVTVSEAKSRNAQAREILFPYKSMELQPQFRELLNAVADELKESQTTVARIVGIVDNRGKGSSDYNRRVANQRAEKVAHYLNNRGVAEDRLHIQEDDSAQGQGNGEKESRPQRLVEVSLVALTD